MRSFAFALTFLALAACGGGSAVNDPDGGTSGADARSDATTGTTDASGGTDSSSGAPDASSEARAPDAGAAEAGCYSNADCAGGSCDYSRTVCTPVEAGTLCTAVFACPGVCVPFSEYGGPCLAGPPPACDPDAGLVCDPFTHQCITAAQEVLPVVDGGGDSCGLGVAECGAGLFCYAPVYPDNGICVPIAGDGGACAPLSAFGTGCSSGLVCEGYGSLLDAGACVPPVPVGGACVEGAAGTGSSGCAGGTLCVDGGCVALPASGACLEGQCDPDAGYCGADGGCARWVQEGGACGASAECATRLCASNTGTCVTELANGAECGSLPYDCSTGLCSTYLGCASGICDPMGHCAATMCPRDGG
jgi:hypothetical protein